MNLLEKIAAVEEVFKALDSHIAAFQQSSTLYCKVGCGECCKKPDIEATVLEFLPLALYLEQSGQAQHFAENIEQAPEGLCPVFTHHLPDGRTGLCTIYAQRGLICRLFGYAAFIDKHEQKQLVTCKIIKTEQAAQYQAAQNALDAGGDVPVMKDYYYQLMAIDNALSEKRWPIRQAIYKAIELVSHYFYYKNQEEAQ